MTMKIVVPGEKISDKPLYLGSAYVKDGKTYTAVVGMLDEDRYTPLEGIYTPKEEDTIVGIVSDTNPKGYAIDINLPNRAFVNSRDIRFKLNMGDTVFGKTSSGRYGDVLIANPKQLSRGKVFKLPTARIPRVIGKKSSMINLIRDATKTQIIVGNNGYVWVSGTGNVALISKVFDEIVKNAHKKGLTDYIAKFIEENNEPIEGDSKPAEEDSKKQGE